MAIIRKCDGCNRVITRDEAVDVSVLEPYAHFELCKKCAAPIMAALKKLKLLPRR
jgi:hypothetical protein